MCYLCLLRAGLVAIFMLSFMILEKYTKIINRVIPKNIKNHINLYLLSH